MSRSSYSDEYGDEFPGQLGLYRGNVDRSLASKKGQARLRELRDALLAMSEKRLVAETFIGPKGEACALGQWAIEHSKDDPEDREVFSRFDGDDNDTADLLGAAGWPRLVVLEAIYHNDMAEYVDGPECEGPHRNEYAYRGHVGRDGWSNRWPVIYRHPETPEERHARVLAWVNEQIAAPPASETTPEGTP